MDLELFEAEILPGRTVVVGQVEADEFGGTLRAERAEIPVGAFDEDDGLDPAELGLEADARELFVLGGLLELEGLGEGELRFGIEGDGVFGEQRSELRSFAGDFEGGDGGIRDGGIVHG